MTAISLTLTDAGLAALAAATMPGGDPVVLSEIGLTAQNFVAAPTLVALPGEFLRLPVSGRSLDDAVVHMVAEDATAATWTVKGIGVYRDDGTLFGTYDHTDAPNADVLVGKAAPAVALIAFDLVFQSGQATLIDFGPATFSYPPATEAEKGVAKIATQALTDAGADDYTIVSPKKLKVRLDAFAATIGATLAAFQVAVNATLGGFGAALDALLARTITGTGVATGGGNLTASRTINVAAATPEQTGAMADGMVVLTPQSIAGFEFQGGTSGYLKLPAWFFGGFIYQWGRLTGSFNTEGQFAANFTTPFTVAVWNVMITTTLASANNNSDYLCQLIDDSETLAGFAVQRQGIGSVSGPISGFRWSAIGK